MTVEKALNRLAWRFSKGSIKEVNATDREALNRVIQHVNDSRSEFAHSNQGFAKLYIWAYMKIMEKHDAGIYDKIPQKELHRALDKPLDWYVGQFHDWLIERESFELWKECGADFSKYSFQMNEVEAKQNKEVIAEVMKRVEENEYDRARFHGETFTREDIKDNLMAMISEALIAYKL